MNYSEASALVIATKVKECKFASPPEDPAYEPVSITSPAPKSNHYPVFYSNYFPMFLCSFITQVDNRQYL